MGAGSCHRQVGRQNPREQGRSKQKQHGRVTQVAKPVSHAQELFLYMETPESRDIDAMPSGDEKTARQVHRAGPFYAMLRDVCTELGQGLEWVCRDGAAEAPA